MTSFAASRLLSLSAWMLCLMAAAASAAEPVKLSPDAAEPQAIEFVTQARASGDAYAAHLALKAWFSRHGSPSPAMLLAAGDTALDAGDLQAAASLYKRFIAAAPADEARSRTAARLYEILVGQLQNTDDAYSFYVRNGLDLRQSPEARVFDSWFLEQARARKDAVTVTNILAAVMADKLPLELERNLFWDHLDWAMSELARATPSFHAAAPAARQIVGLVRESKPRAARYNLITSWLEFQSAAAGKDAAALAAGFAPVAAAASAYVDAVPTAATLSDGLNIFSCGTGDGVWQSVGVPINAWWTASFEKLADAEKAKALNWDGQRNQQASAEQWTELGAKFPQLFRESPGTARLAMVNKPDLAIFTKQATFLAGVPSRAARLVNAINATKGSDIAAGLKHLLQSESWHGDFPETFAGAEQLWNTYRTLPRQPATTEAEWQRALAAWGAEAIARTPIALFDSRAVVLWLNAAFAIADPADKSAFAAELRRLDWVPWDEKTRQATITPAHEAFKAWANQIRTRLTAAQAAAKAAPNDKAKADEAAKWEKAAGQITPLEEEFKKAFDVNVSATADVAKLADPLAMHLAGCVRALREKKRDAYLASGRAAYALVRDFSAQKSPFGSASLRWLVTNRFDAFDTADFQAEVIADQISLWQPGKPAAALVAIDTSLGRQGGTINTLTVEHKAHVLTINAAIGKAILSLLEKNRFEPELLTRFRASRGGQGWKDLDAGSEVMAKLIDTKALLAHNQPRAVYTYQALVKNEFPSLAKTYPPESFFDDMFVEESKKTGWLDWGFLGYSRDEKQKAVSLAAEMFAGYTGLASGPNAPKAYDKLPQRLGAGGRELVLEPATWTTEEVKDWYARALSAPKEPRAKFVAAAEAAWGTSRFDPIAMGYASLPVDPAATATPEGRTDFFKKLATILERRKSFPVRIGVPTLQAISQLPAKSLSPEELAILLAVFSSPLPPTWQSGAEGLVLAEALQTAGRDADLVRVVPELWRIAKVMNSASVATQVAAFATGVAKAGKPGLAAAIAESGQQILGASLPEVASGQLAAIRADAMLSLGGGNPVPRNDPRWPIYESQIQFAAGKLQGAWELYVPNAATVAKMYKELDPEFTAWLIRENTQTGNYDRARELGQLLLAWSEANPTALSPEGQAGLLMAYADIALARREYAQARALYERIAAAKEFEDTVGKRNAELRVAEVDRLTRQFDKARDLLTRLTRRPDRALQTEAYYQLALLKTDQEEIEEASKFLEEAFARTPNHVGGRILEGRLNILRRKYDVASKVKLGVLGDKKFLIPGKPLEVDLEDRNLAVVGKATQIEIRVWTAGGDEEMFNLFPFGDSKTRFTGQIPTLLGPPVKGNKVLEVAGGDTVRYSFAESFAARKEGFEEPPPMTVVSDSDLFASSGAILSKEELESRALERMIRERLKLEDPTAANAAAMALTAMRADDQIKPGNAVNVRVVDPDRSTTADRDTIDVRTTTASGDSLVVKLTETAPHSAIFEGTVPTGSGQATAYASDSTDGNDPSNAIGPERTTPWVALADNKRPKTFSVDFNDNVALGTMSVTANVPGRKLKDVYVQTSFNGRDFRTVGQWRADGKAAFVPWDGGPRAEFSRFVGNPQPFANAAAFTAYFDRERLATGSPLAIQKIDSLSVGPLDATIGGNAKAMELNTEWFVGHWVAGFEMAKAQARTFTLDPKGKLDNVHYVFTVDGKPSTDPKNRLKASLPLKRGVHRIDVYALAKRSSGLTFDVLTDTAEPPFTAVIPKETLSIEEHPAIADVFGTAPAEIKANADGSVIDVAFAKGARARVVRLIIADFETDAPAISMVALVDAAGKKVLPTERSFQDMAKNDILEIIPGDKLSILYEDPTVITPEKATQQRFLTATFTDATMSAAFVEFSESNGERRARYVPMRRFKPGDPVKVFIADADLDTSPEPDRATFTVRAGRGQPVEIEALETEPNSGVFIGTIFPVAGKPQRPTEIEVAAGDDLVLTYLDRENTDPGIPWERTNSVEQVGSDDPELRVYDVASRPLDEAELKTASEKQEAAGRRFEEKVAITREIMAVRPEKVAAADTPASVLVDGPLLVEVLAPAIAKSAESRTEIYVQTQAGRERLGREVAEGEFPLDVPGTIRLAAVPGFKDTIPVPPGVSRVVVRGDQAAFDPLTDGRFTFLVDKQLGPVPPTSLAANEATNLKPTLQIRGNDTVFVGHKSTTPAGEERWIVQPVKLTSDILFDVMDERYRESVEGTYVGNSLHVRLMHAALDVSDDKDRATVKLTASGGGELELALTETFGHSGVFKGAVKLAYRQANQAPAEGSPPPDGRTLPVAYGETVTLRYAPPTGDPVDRSVLIFKGGDALVVPFTKRFNDPEIAVQTQFTVAEAWFELAKRHRDLGQESLARREIAQGKKLLEEAIRDYPNTEARAQADYLLANLSYEFSKEATNEEIAKQHALDAVARFSDIVASHPESEYAPKSQYKKGLVLETLGDIDRACEEYVKLSYRYPDNELVAETIARLGQYFLSKGKQLEEESQAAEDAVEKEKVAIRGREMYTTAGEVFGRLGERFPRHALAMKTKMLSGQCFMRAKEFKRAMAAYEAIFKDSQADKDLAAEAMYWFGDINMQGESPKAKDAYRAWKKLTWDYPETKWAKFARGRLTEDVMVQAEQQLEEQK